MSTSWRGGESAGQDPEPDDVVPTDPGEADVAYVATPHHDDQPYVPPEPPPLPPVAPATVLGSLTAIIGVGLLFYPAILTSFLGISTTFALLLAGLLFGVGAATLVSRLHNPDPDEPEDPEQGAKV